MKVPPLLTGSFSPAILVQDYEYQDVRTMLWDNSDSLTKTIVDLENAEQRFTSGERSAALRQAALRTYNSASANTNSAQANWRREVMERAKHIIDECS